MFIYSFIHSWGCLLIHHIVYEFSYLCIYVIHHHVVYVFSYLSVCLCFTGIEANVVMQKQKMVIGALLRDMAIIDPDPFTVHKKVSLSHWVCMEEKHSP